MSLKTAILPLFLLVFTLFEPITARTLQAQEQRPQVVFEQANQQLQQGNINRAIEIYQQLEQRNQISGALFLNLGLSYIQLDSMGKAKYYFLKSREFEETRERAQKGLNYVENRFSRQSAVLPTLPWQRALNWLQETISGAGLLAIGLILLNIGVFVYIFRWFRPSIPSAISTTAIVVATAGLLIILLGFYVDYRADRYHQAVMVTREATVREQPAADATVVSQAFEGYTFSVDRHQSQEQQAWTYIQMSNGQYGWIPSKEIMIL